MNGIKGCHNKFAIGLPFCYNVIAESGSLHGSKRPAHDKTACHSESSDGSIRVCRNTGIWENTEDNPSVLLRRSMGCCAMNASWTRSSTVSEGE
jgi:hypothetical protein